MELDYIEYNNVKKKVNVAPCIQCFSTEIVLTDFGYSSFNIGGGRCKNCGREATSSCSTFPKLEELAKCWNIGNDVDYLIAKENKSIEVIKKRIQKLEEKRKKQESKIVK